MAILDPPPYFKDFAIAGLAPIDYHRLKDISHTPRAQMALRLNLVELIYNENPSTVDPRVVQTWCAGVRPDPSFSPETYVPLPLSAQNQRIAKAHSHSLTILPGESPTQAIMRMRQEQSHWDYNSAAQLRAQILEAICTTARPSDLRQLAGALRDVQAIQRVSLGLGVDNVGFTLEGHDSQGAQLPTVQVLLNEVIDVSATPTPSSAANDQAQSASGIQGAVGAA